MADRDLEISVGQTQKTFFRPFGPQFGLKIRGVRAPRAPPPGFAPEKLELFGIRENNLKAIQIHNVQHSENLLLNNVRSWVGLVKFQDFIQRF